MCVWSGNSHWSAIISGRPKTHYPYQPDPWWSGCWFSLVRDARLQAGGSAVWLSGPLYKPGLWQYLLFWLPKPIPRPLCNCLSPKYSRIAHCWVGKKKFWHHLLDSGSVAGLIDYLQGSGLQYHKHCYVIDKLTGYMYVYWCNSTTYMLNIHNLRVCLYEKRH